ncbi:MAG: ATP-binding protein [bacterium]
MKTFKFGQLLEKEDICDREGEIKALRNICKTGGRAVVYGSRRFGKTSLVKNVVIPDFLKSQKKPLAVYVDLFQLDSMHDASTRLQVAIEHALSERAKVKTFLNDIRNYIKGFRIEISADPLSGAPKVGLSGGAGARDEKTLQELFNTLKAISADYKTLLVLDEFQDIAGVTGLEASFRSEIQSLSDTPVIALGSKKHLLHDIFHNESRPFYGFGVDVEIRKIDRKHWLPYMKERFAGSRLTLDKEGVDTICEHMRDVPNSIQELCQWISLNDEKRRLEPSIIMKHIADLLENKSSRYFEKAASFTAKERAVLTATARMEPVSSIASTGFIQQTGISATAVRAAVHRFADQGVLDHSEEGYVITDPLFRLFLKRQFIHDDVMR